MMMTALRGSLVAVGLLAATTGFALAQQAPAFDPAQLPAIHGKVAMYTLTPRGDVDGFILQDGLQIHLPPHLSAQLVYAVKPGDIVTVHGLKALAIPMVDAMSVKNDATGQTVVDSGPPGLGPRGPAAAGQLLTAQGRVKMQLHGPRGELNGVVLEDGTQIHLPPPEAARLSADLAPGQTIYAQGSGVADMLGRSIAATRIGPSPAQAVAIASPPPPRPRRPHGPPPPPQQAQAFAPAGAPPAPPAGGPAQSQ